MLIEPPYFRLYKDAFSSCRYPFALGYLAGSLKKNTEWDVLCYNTDFNSLRNDPMKISYLTGPGYDNYLNNLREFTAPVWNEVRSTIVNYRPSIIGISSKSQNFASAQIVAKLAKEIDPRIIVIVGGPHSSMVGADVLKCKDIDICVKGEGEVTIVELVRAIEQGATLADIKGVIYRKEGQIVENGSREFIKDLNALSFPHENASEVLKDFEKYPVRAFRNVFATRGCPYNCFFCGSHKIWTRKVRFRSPENVIEEIKGLQEMGIDFINFDDDTFGVNKKYLKVLCEAIIEHCPGIKWGCEVHVKLIDKETVDLMKKAGCQYIQLGIESGNNDMLKRIRKNITIEEAFSACKIIKKHGIKLYAFFIVGFPWETEETLRDTVEAMKKIKCNVLTYSIFNPYPGTEAFEFCKKHDLLDDTFDVALYNHQSPACCFCLNIKPERFRILASQIEKIVDKKNSFNRVKQGFSIETYKKIKQLGIKESIRKVVKTFIT